MVGLFVFAGLWSLLIVCAVVFLLPTPFIEFEGLPADGTFINPHKPPPLPAVAPTDTYQLLDNTDCDSGDCTGLVLTKVAPCRDAGNKNGPPNAVATTTGEPEEFDVTNGLFKVFLGAESPAELVVRVARSGISASALFQNFLPLFAKLASSCSPSCSHTACSLVTSRDFTGRAMSVARGEYPLHGFLGEVAAKRMSATELLAALFPTLMFLAGVRGDAVVAQLHELKSQAVKTRARTETAKSTEGNSSGAPVGDFVTEWSLPPVDPLPNDNKTDDAPDFDLGGEG